MAVCYLLRNIHVQDVRVRIWVKALELENNQSGPDYAADEVAMLVRALHVPDEPPINYAQSALDHLRVLAAIEIKDAEGNGVLLQLNNEETTPVVGWEDEVTYVTGEEDADAEGM